MPETMQETMRETMRETMSEPQPRPYQPIEAYALLSNCEGCALVARDGGID